MAMYWTILLPECSDFVSNFRVSNKISDYMALHASLTCQRPHPERKKIYVRSLRRINTNELAAGLSACTIFSTLDMSQAYHQLPI